ncbi:MAG: hypothetical protein VX642_15900 [Bdellovibrionota bacterium]|nr:hypothetical protein [Bdellovibrionota bacterium]
MILKYIQLVLFQAALIYLCNTGIANGRPEIEDQSFKSEKTWDYSQLPPLATND